MKKLFAILLTALYCFSCTSSIAETQQAFNYKQLSKLPGYKYNSSDRSWEYSDSTYCMGQKSPTFFTDTHLIYIALTASGELDEPQVVETNWSILAMNTNGKIEDVDTVTFMFKANSEIITVTIDNYGVFCPENSEVLKYLSEGTNFTGIMKLENSSTTIHFYPTDLEMEEIKEIARNMYDQKVANYIVSYMKNYAKRSITYTVE